MKQLFANLLRTKSTTSAHLPAGMRVYAIGDIHGRLDLLKMLLDCLAADDAARGSADTRLVLLGDLIDRGPQSAEVVGFVMDIMKNDPNVRVIKGNHEEIFVSAVRGDARAARSFLSMGGVQTLQSYGFTDGEIGDGGYEDLVRVMADRLPAEHLAFLEQTEDFVRYGDYVFVHAGIRPGVPLEKQDPKDLRWIRGPFLNSRADHSVIVVHGHTPTEQVDEWPNRIGIDTGAFASGLLTAIGLEADQRWYVAVSSEPCEEGAVS